MEFINFEGETASPSPTPTGTPSVVITMTEEQQTQAEAQASAQADYQATMRADLDSVKQSQIEISKEFDNYIETFNKWSNDVYFVLQVILFVYLFEWCWSHMREWRRQLTRKDK